MNTLEALENFSQLCDQLSASMQTENCILRGSNPLGEEAAGRARENVSRLDTLLVSIRSASAVPTSDRPRARELRDRVMQKLLKLMLLSRESEQLLLLKGSSQRPVKAPAPTVAQFRSAYQASCA